MFSITGHVPCLHGTAHTYNDASVHLTSVGVERSYAAIAAYMSQGLGKLRFPADQCKRPYRHPKSS
jgi:hypothetical protein